MQKARGIFPVLLHVKDNLYYSITAPNNSFLQGKALCSLAKENFIFLVKL